MCHRGKKRGYVTFSITIAAIIFQNHSYPTYPHTPIYTHINQYTLTYTNIIPTYTNIYSDTQLYGNLHQNKPVYTHINIPIYINIYPLSPINTHTHTHTRYIYLCYILKETRKEITYFKRILCIYSPNTKLKEDSRSRLCAGNHRDLNIFRTYIEKGKSNNSLVFKVDSGREIYVKYYFVLYLEKKYCKRLSIVVLFYQ